MNICGHWLHVGNEGQQGGSSNVHRDPGDCEAVSRRAAALLLNFYGPLKESRNSDAVVTERYSIVTDKKPTDRPTDHDAVTLGFVCVIISFHLHLA